jgi:uncharacterized protein YigA (DUF484 family)
MSHFNDRTEAERISRSAPSVTPEAVRAFLLAHPDFVINDPQLLAALVPSRSDGRNVVDMQQYVIGRLQSQVRTLRDIQSDLIEASSMNSLAREQVHNAVCALLDARNFEHLIDYITSPEGLVRSLGIHAAALCIETSNGVSGIGLRSIRVLEPGGVARMMEGDVPYRLVANVRGSRSLYNHLADEVQSEALVRLEFARGAPVGLLALGGHSPEQFHPDQAADLLEFLARIVERCVRRWLDLPPAL